jgi:hypothetical protein
VQIRTCPLVEPRIHLLHGRFERFGRQASVVGQAQALLFDPSLGQGALHHLAVTRPILVVLGQVEHAFDTHAGQHLDVVPIARVGADEQVIQHVGEAVGAEPSRHPSMIALRRGRRISLRRGRRGSSPG